MATILKVEKERIPAVKLTGIKYTNADRGPDGSFACQWERWFQKGYFNQIESCERAVGVGGDYIGAMRMGPDGFEYWIGMLIAPQAEIPEGFEAVEIPAGELGVCYVYGKDETGELFGMDVHQACVRSWEEKGWKVSADGWYLERYNWPRYTTPDEKGNVILDYCAYMQCV